MTRRLHSTVLPKNRRSCSRGESEEVFEELLKLNGSSMRRAPEDRCPGKQGDKSKIIHGQAKLKPGFEHWMIKFANSQDPRDIGAIEYAYSLMAKDAGVNMPETHLFRTKKRGYFGVKRFDRHGDKRLHMHSLSGLIHADHRTPALDYNLLLRVVLVLTKNIIEVEKAYALACFNVLAHNRDDHARNFSFLMNRKPRLDLCPAPHDLTFSDRSCRGEQSHPGDGRRQETRRRSNWKALGKEHNLKNAPRILARVQKAIMCAMARSCRRSRRQREIDQGDCGPNFSAWLGRSR